MGGKCSKNEIELLVQTDWVGNIYGIGDGRYIVMGMRLCDPQFLMKCSDIKITLRWLSLEDVEVLVISFPLEVPCILSDSNFSCLLNRHACTSFIFALCFHYLLSCFLNHRHVLQIHGFPWCFMSLDFSFWDFPNARSCTLVMADQ